MNEWKHVKDELPPDNVSVLTYCSSVPSEVHVFYVSHFRCSTGWKRLPGYEVLEWCYIEHQPSITINEMEKDEYGCDVVIYQKSGWVPPPLRFIVEEGES